MSETRLEKVTADMDEMPGLYKQAGKMLEWVRKEPLQPGQLWGTLLSGGVPLLGRYSSAGELGTACGLQGANEVVMLWPQEHEGKNYVVFHAVTLVDDTKIGHQQHWFPADESWVPLYGSSHQCFTPLESPQATDFMDFLAVANRESGRTTFNEAKSLAGRTCDRHPYGIAGGFLGRMMKDGHPLPNLYNNARGLGIRARENGADAAVMVRWTSEDRFVFVACLDEGGSLHIGGVRGMENSENIEDLTVFEDVVALAEGWKEGSL